MPRSPRPQKPGHSPTILRPDQRRDVLDILVRALAEGHLDPEDQEAAGAVVKALRARGAHLTAAQTSTAMRLLAGLVSRSGPEDLGKP